jgi:hypothetical protein
MAITRGQWPVEQVPARVLLPILRVQSAVDSPHANNRVEQSRSRLLLQVRKTVALKIIICTIKSDSPNYFVSTF